MKKILLVCALTVMTLSAVRAQFVWYDGHQPVSYQVVGRVDPVVHVALQMFSDDIEQVTGQRPEAVRRDATIRIVQGRGSDDGFRISITPERHLLLEGHNARGTAYAILELSRLAGVSPWVWWGDVVPERRDRLMLPDTFFVNHTPSVAYRGVFINDEDWSLRRWATQTVEPGGQAGVIGPRTYKKIFQLLLRLRANTIWPAMHEGTAGFFTVAGNKLMADSCAILIGSSHCEPLLRNNVAEWDHSRRGDYNYITNRSQVQQYWTERLQEVKGSEELFTIGMRGIHDGSMEGVKTPEEKLLGLQQVIDDQRTLIRKYYNKRVEQVPQVFIPYKEVLEIMESGLRVPDDVTLMWCDDNYGYLTRLPDAEQQRRSGGGGIYYHLSYWGRPHDHLWLTTTQPGLVYSELRAAYDHNCRRVWIANVHDPKVAAYDLELFLDMAWDIDAILPNGNGTVSTDNTAAPSSAACGSVTLDAHLGRWLTTQFGSRVGRELLPVMRDFYRLNAIRRPEFMGWTQVELDKKKYPGGKSSVSAIEFTPAEAACRLEDFGRMKATVDKCQLLVRPELRDAFFAHVVYPVYASAAMTRKLVSDSIESRQAYDEIQQLTARYNAMNGGKWRGLMDAAPRRLPVFDNVRGQLANGAGLDGIARNACDYQQYVPAAGADATAGSHSGSGNDNYIGSVNGNNIGAAPVTVQLLGHSMSAVQLPRGAELVYEFTTDREGAAMLYTAMIPTQPSDRGDLRYSVQLDDSQPVIVSLKEPFRSERWKQNVLRGQALRSMPVTITRGRHVLRIRALDDHIIADQWALDFHPQRGFYELKTEN